MCLDHSQFNKCLHISGLDPNGNIFETYGCNFPTDIWNFLSPYMTKYQTNFGKITGKLSMKFAGLTLHAQGNFDDIPLFINKIGTGLSISTNVDMNLNIDELLAIQVKASFDGIYPKVTRSYDLKCC